MSLNERYLSMDKPVRTTFVLPDRNRSGGVRVTVEMANRLLALGYPVRIAYRRVPQGVLKRAQATVRGGVRRLAGAVHDDWLPSFRGPTEPFAALSDLGYERGEVVIAVGSMVVPEVHGLEAPVVRVRFCHGFHSFLPDRMRAAWSMAMPTLTVSATLIPGLRAHNDRSPVWLVPNGIDGSEYFDEGRERDGVGTIFSRNQAKCPEDVLRVMSLLPSRVPGAERYVFGESRRPREIPRAVYRQLPALAKARELYNRSKIWLLMSRAEGLPGPVLEAMACGAVVISSDNEGSREIIRHEENGLLFRVGDVGGCLDLVERVWGDEGLRERLARAGFETARAFSWERAVERMRACLHDLATGGEASACPPAQERERAVAAAL